MEQVPVFILAIIIIGIVVVLFLILRTVVLWYYKIDERVNLMKENNKLLRTLIREVGDIDSTLNRGSEKAASMDDTPPLEPIKKAKEVDIELPPYLEPTAEKMVARAEKGDRIIYNVTADQVEIMNPQKFEMMLSADIKYKILIEL